MDDLSAKNNLIRFVEKQCYSDITHKETRRNYAIKRCIDLQEKYTWPALKRAANENYCTSMSKLEEYARKHKDLASKMAR